MTNPSQIKLKSKIKAQKINLNPKNTNKNLI